MQVKLLAITPNGEQLVASAYGICTNKIVPLENIAKWMNMGHLSPLEHISATFLIEGISRACLAQLTRHRLCAYSVESMRYVSMQSNPIVIPESIASDNSLLDEAQDLITYCDNVYASMIAAGVPKEDARFLLPMGHTTRLIMTANARQWLHIFSQRCTPQAQWEINSLSNRIRVILSQQWPHIIKIGDEHDTT